jgi:hypothetical protein
MTDRFDVCLVPLSHNVAYGNPNLIAWLLQSSETFRLKAVPSMRDSYLDVIEDYAKQHTKGEPCTPRDTLRVQMAMCNWMNPICIHCGKKEPGTMYIPCDKCYLYHYCSVQCKCDDADTHAIYCGKKEAPYDEHDPTRPAMMQLK